MKFKYLTIICFIFSLQYTFAQGYDCGWYGTKNVEQRNKIFPFNKAKRVLLISYPFGFDLPVENDTLYTKTIVKKWDKQLESFEGRYTIKEEVEINEAWVNMLSHTLINYTVKKYPTEEYGIPGDLCSYQPRNSILFLDESNSVICCLEICFTCGHCYMKPDPDGINKFANIHECQDRFDELLFIFKKKGVTYGTQQ